VKIISLVRLEVDQGHWPSRFSSLLKILHREASLMRGAVALVDLVAINLLKPVAIPV
jgi:hypothetical protein